MSAATHDGLHELSGLYALGALTGEERADFESHLRSCDQCQADVRSFAPVVDALARAVPEREPSTALRGRVLDAVAGDRPARVDRARAIDTTGRRRWLSDAGWLAAAACFAGMLVVGYTARDRQHRVIALESRLREVTLRANAADRQIADVRRTASEAQASLAVLMAPDVARVDLEGQPVAPSATGRAYWSRSRGLVFTASNLPPLPAGRVYQLWVVTARAPVSAGLLTPDAAGRVTATIDTPRDLPTPVAMAVTLEPEGGVAAPTGEKYLVGTPGAGL